MLEQRKEAMRKINSGEQNVIDKEGTVHLIFWGGGGWDILEKNFLALILTKKKINLLNGTVKKIIYLQ